MSKEIADVLRAAREKIAVPERWTKGTFARSKDGKPSLLRSQTTACWCAEGAIIVNGRGSTIDYAISAVADSCGWPSLHCFNDAPTTTHADILAAFSRAIAEQERAP